MIVDKYNRIHDYLRISLTDNCNLRCFYCMPEEEYDFTPPAKLMQAAEIETLASIFVANGIKKIRLTGGEPLVRKDAKDIILRLSKLPVQLTLTTNATRLHDFLPTLQQAGIKSINISLDTLDPATFQLITRRDLFTQTMDNISLMLQHGIEVKINTVIMKGVNDREINDFVAWTKTTPVHVRFIEFMPFKGNRWSSNKVFTLAEILSVIREKYDIISQPGNPHDTSKVYTINGHQGDLAVISTMSAPFCSGCNRIRLTADGKIKNCLFSEEETDLLQALRNGQEVLPLLQQSIQAKAKELGGQFTADIKTVNSASIHNRSMITIGG